MITFEQIRELEPGDTIYQATGWRNNRPTAWAEFEVTAIHTNSVDLVATDSQWGRHCRLNRSEFPLVYFCINPGER
jgi:hypothetical protein